MKILAIADIYEFNWDGDAPMADVLVSCGDVDDTVILEAAKACQCEIAMAVKGNHDRDAPFPESVIDLHLNLVEFHGVKFGGFNGSWKYKPRGHFLHEQEEAANLMADFPPVDVLVAHNSPRWRP